MPASRLAEARHLHAASNPTSTRPLSAGLAALVLAASLVGGCVVYEPVPYGTAPVASGFDRSWSAAIGAMQEQGVQVTSQDRSAGVVRGSRGGIDVTANVRTQADGRVRVEFNTSGATGQDPTLIDRITQSYNRRMGR